MRRGQLDFEAKARLVLVTTLLLFSGISKLCPYRPRSCYMSLSSIWPGFISTLFLHFLFISWALKFCSRMDLEHVEELPWSWGIWSLQLDFCWVVSVISSVLMTSFIPSATYMSNGVSISTSLGFISSFVPCSLLPSILNIFQLVELNFLAAPYTCMYPSRSSLHSFTPYFVYSFMEDLHFSGSAV